MRKENVASDPRKGCGMLQLVQDLIDFCRGCGGVYQIMFSRWIPTIYN